MQSPRITKSLTAVSPISLLLLTVCFAVTASGQDSDAKFLSGPELILSKDAIAAGIDGVYRAGLSIDEAGNVKNVRLYGDPAWPCGTSPKRELADLRTAVEQHLRTIKFSPSMKNGKARAADVMLEFAIGNAFKQGPVAADAKKGVSPKTVRAGVVNGRAIRLVKPHSGIGVRGIAVAEVLIDEQGNVSKAGMFMGDPLLSSVVRDAACQSKFSPTFLDGEPVQVTGRINYQFLR